MVHGRLEEDENCHGQCNPFSIAASWPEIQGHEVKDSTPKYMSRWQVFEQIAHLEEEYQEVGEPQSYEDNYYIDMLVPDAVIGMGTILEDRSEKKNGKN